MKHLLTPKITSDLISETETEFKYYMGGLSCVAGDYVGPYFFTKKLKIDDDIIIEDAMQYTMVKNTFFNGIPMPSIGILKSKGTFQLLRKFSYQDYKSRLS